MTTRRRRHLHPLLAAAVLASTAAAAHGLLVSIHGQGSFVVGTVYYSNGQTGAGQYAELTDLDAPGSKPQTGKTDAAGGFRFRGTPGHRYRFLTEGEEGHRTEMRITLADGAKGRFVDRDARPASGWMPPAWLVVGGLMLALTGLIRLRNRMTTRRGPIHGTASSD